MSFERRRTILGERKIVFIGCERVLRGDGLFCAEKVEFSLDANEFCAETDDLLTSFERTQTSSARPRSRPRSSLARRRTVLRGRQQVLRRDQRFCADAIELCTEADVLFADEVEYCSYDLVDLTRPLLSESEVKVTAMGLGHDR